MKKLLKMFGLTDQPKRNRRKFTSGRKLFYEKQLKAMNKWQQSPIVAWK